jgi:hypothetical protein
MTRSKDPDIELFSIWLVVNFPEIPMHLQEKIADKVEEIFVVKVKR